MNFNLILILTYTFLLPIYLLFIVQQGFAFKAKYKYLCEVSGLGEVRIPQHRIYNLVYFIFGLLSLVLTYNLDQLLTSSFSTSIGIFFFYITDISLCFIALFPRDKYQKLHTIFSFILFISRLISMLFLTSSFFDSALIPNFIILLNISITILLAFYSYLKLRNIVRFGINNDMEKIVSKWEWIPFSLTFLWGFILAIVIIIHIY